MGSPMPMKTTFSMRSPKTCRATSTCDTISPASRSRRWPSLAVSQNAQPILQPTCDETHSDL